MTAVKKRTRAVALVAVIGAGVSTAGVALAQGPVEFGGTMNVAPESVEPGESYVISNDPASPCLLGQVSGDTGGVRPGAWFTEPDEEGNWSVTIEVPANGAPDAGGNPTPFPAGEYEQHAFCEQPDEVEAAAAPEGRGEFPYEPVTVTVVAPAVDEEEETPPPAAEPAAEAPTFTG